jgi:hypothetical protein
MKQISLIFAATLMSLNAWPQSSAPAGGDLLWKDQTGKPVPASESRQSSKGFGGMLLVTPDPDWKKKWDTPAETTPQISETHTVTKGSSLTVLIFFSNPKADKKGQSEIRCDLKVTRPDGKREVDKMDQECFLGKIGPNPNHVFLANQAIGFIAEAKDPKGKWLVDVSLTDKHRQAKLDLKTYFELK